MTDILDSFNLNIDEMASFTCYSMTTIEILLMNSCSIGIMHLGVGFFLQYLCLS